jgi:superkiller protein 3
VEEKWDEAERHLRAAAEVDPRSAEVHNTLGSYYLRRRNLTGAKEEFQKAISLRDRFAWAYYNLGLVLREQGESTAAKQAFRQALAADPGLTAARTALERMDTKKEDMQPR